MEDIPRDIVPDMRTPDSLLRALEDKEQKLALLLNLNVNDEPTVTKIGEFHSYKVIHRLPNLFLLSTYDYFCEIEVKTSNGFRI